MKPTVYMGMQLMRSLLITIFFIPLTFVLYGQTYEEYIEKGKVTENLNEKVELFKKAVESNPYEWNGQYLLGKALYDLGKYSEAIESFDESIKYNEEYYLSYSYRGVSRGKLGDNEGMIDDLEKDIELNPEHKWAYYTLGQLYFKLEEWQKAIDQFNIVIEKDINYENVVSLKSQAEDWLLRSQWKIKNAEREFEEQEIRDRAQNMQKNYQDLQNRDQKIIERKEALLLKEEELMIRFEKVIEGWEKQQKEYQDYLNNLIGNNEKIIKHTEVKKQ